MAPRSRAVVAAPLLIAFVATVLLAAPGLVAVADATPTAAVDPWVQLTQNEGRTTDEVSGVRATDGTLRLVYADDSPSLGHALRTRMLSAKGILGPLQTIESGWLSMGQPDIEFVSGSVPTVFWGGQHSADGADPASTGQAWASAYNGVAWSRSVAPITTAATAAASTQVSTAIGPDGQPWLGWTPAGGLFTHLGLLTTGAEQSLSPGCCQSGANLARDARTGAVALVYRSDQGGRTSIWTERVAPAHVEATQLPSSSVRASSLHRTTRVPAASRSGGGIYTAYCTTGPRCTNIRLAGTGTRSLDLAVPAGADSVWTAAGPEGRMWLLWSSGATVHAVRSNAALTRWGAVVDAGAPLRTTAVWNLYGNGTYGPLDVIANTTSRGSIHQFHRRVLPGLTVTPPVGGVQGGGLRVIRVFITDAGAGVRGSVTLSGVTHTTDANGRATFVLPSDMRAGSYPISAKATGYTHATSNLRVAG